LYKLFDFTKVEERINDDAVKINSLKENLPNLASKKSKKINKTNKP
jgi:hypothetical protein